MPRAHRWREALSKHRSDSSVHRAAFEVLVEQPVLTAGSLQQHLAVTKMAVHTTLEALLNAEILRPAGGKLQRSNLYQATEILDPAQEIGVRSSYQVMASYPKAAQASRTESAVSSSARRTISPRTW